MGAARRRLAMAEQPCAGAQPRAVALVLAVGALLLQLAGSTAATQRQVMPNAHELSAFDGENPKYYFYNEITNEVQWDDPGGALLCVSGCLARSPSCTACTAIS